MNGMAEAEKEDLERAERKRLEGHGVPSASEALAADLHRLEAQVAELGTAVKAIAIRARARDA
jgi:hypothetical protein